MSSASNLPMIPPGVNIVNFTVSPLIAALLNWGLFGVLTVQVYIYYLNFSDDKKISKILVYGVYLIEVVQTAMSAVDIWYWFGVGFGNWDYLMDTYTSPFNVPLLCGIVALVVQLFFAYRIWIIQQHQRGGRLVVGVIVIMALVQTVGASMTAYEASRLGRFDRFHESSAQFTLAYYMWLLGDTIADLLIAGAMLWILYSNRKNSNLSGSSKLLARLVKLIVETNTLTASMALLSLTLKASMPNASLFIVTSVVMGKLYSNTLLVTFNNRITLRKTTLSVHSNSHHSAPSFSASAQSRAGVDSIGQTAVQPPDQKSSFMDLEHSTDAFGFREDAHVRETSHGLKRDVENIQIQILKDVEVSKGPGNWQGDTQGRQVRGPVCRRCGCGA